jgi:hypothetical protein
MFGHCELIAHIHKFESVPHAKVILLQTLTGEGGLRELKKKRKLFP